MDVDVKVALIAGSVSLLVALITTWASRSVIRKGEQEKLRALIFTKQLEAYQKLWTVLRHASYFSPNDADVIIARTQEGVFLNLNVVNTMFAELRTFFYSELGIYISKGLRQKIFEVRDFVLKVIEDATEPAQNTQLKIYNRKAKSIESGFDWIRKYIRKDIGLEDLIFPVDEIDLN